MAKDAAIDERIERVQAIIRQLEAGELDASEVEHSFEEAQRDLDEVRDILRRGDGEVVELSE